MNPWVDNQLWNEWSIDGYLITVNMINQSNNQGKNEPRNRLKFGMSTLFVLKNVPVFVFKNAGKCGQNSSNSTPPPPPPLSVRLQISIFECQNTVHVSLRYWRETEVGGGGRGEGGGGCEKGGGLNFQECVWSLASPLVEKNTGTFFTTKRVRHAKFQPIRSNLENRYEIVT